LSSGRLFAQYENRFKGKVKSSKIYYYRQQDNKRHLVGKVETSYDINGLTTIERGLIKLGTKETLITLDSNIYDNSGRRVMINRTLPDVDTSKTTYTFNKDNNLVETYYAWAGKGETSRTVYDKVKMTDTLYRDGKPSPVKIVRHINSLQDEEIMFHGENEFVSESRPLFAGTGIIPHKSLITYDSKHNKVDEILFKLNGERGSHEMYYYDNDSNLLKYIDSNRMYIGRHISTTEKTPYTFSTIYKYHSYDNMHNWQKQYILFNGQFVLTVRRKIRYYP
jgi:hypothetical protein